MKVSEDMQDAHNADIFQQVVQALRTAVVLVDHTRKIFFWNEAAEKITGYRSHEVIGHACRHNILPQCDEQACDLCNNDCPIARPLREGKPQFRSLLIQKKDGHSTLVDMWTTPIRNTHGSVIGAAQSFAEAHTLASNPRPAHHSSLDDPASLPNHEYTQLFLREQLTAFAHHGVPFGILLIQLNELERLNNSYGHAAERATVSLMARTVRENTGNANFFGRWTQNEFLLIELNSDFAELAEAALQIQDCLHHLSLHWWGDVLPVTSAVGYAITQSGDTIDSLIQRAQSTHPSDRAHKLSAASNH